MRRIVILLLALVALALASAVVVRRAGEAKLERQRARFESEVGSLDLATYALPPLADEDNAAARLLAGARAVELSESEQELLRDVLDQELAAVSAEVHAAVEPLLASNQTAFELMERSLGLQRSTLGFRYQEGFNAEVPPLLELYRAGRLVRLDSRWALLEGDLDRLSRDVEILDQLGRALARESFLIAAIVHLAVERLLLATVHDVVGSGVAATELLANLERRLGRRDSAEVLRRSLAAEAAAALAAESSDNHSMPLQNHLERLRVPVLEPYRVAGMLQTYADLSRAFDSPWIETLQGWKIEAQKATWKPHQVLIPNLLDTVDKLKAIELGRDLAIEALGLRRRYLETGEYPDQLETAMRDPYAAGPVRYELQPDGSAILSAPGAETLWQAEHAGAARHLTPLSTWLLPASTTPD